jgi:predicted O-methyltransferase YrrM
MNWKQRVISFLNTLPYVRGLYQENMNYRKNSCFSPGHFYSPIVSVDDIKERQDKIWKHEKFDGVGGVYLNVEGQKKLLQQFEPYYEQIPFTEHKDNKNRYYFENDFYSYTDAIVLYSMIRHYRPKQIIEVGSGFSSAVMLDTNEYFFGNSIQLTFIEPYTDRLRSLLKKQDYNFTQIIEKKVQEVEVETFKKLNAGDILFIDSSHVCKTGSDVNYIFFEILPALNSGVFIHFHDIFYPFEYPKEWVFMGRNWNEDYLLRAFLMYNSAFEIKIFSHYLHKLHSEVFKNMPLCYKNSGGNLWLMKKQ